MEFETKLPAWSWKKSVALFLAGPTFLIVQTTISTWLAPLGYGPDFCLVVVLYSGLYIPLTVASVFVTLLGLFRDAAGGGLFGFYPAIFLIMLALVRSLRQNFDPAAPWYLLVFTMLLTLASGLLSILSLTILGRTVPILSIGFSSPVIEYLVSAGTTALAAPVVFWVMNALKLQTESKAPQET